MVCVRLPSPVALGRLTVHRAFRSSGEVQVAKDRLLIDSLETEVNLIIALAPVFLGLSANEPYISASTPV